MGTYLVLPSSIRTEHFFSRAHPCDLPKHKNLVFYVHFIGVNPPLLITIIRVLEVICTQISSHLQMSINYENVVDVVAPTNDQRNPDERANDQVDNNEQPENLRTSSNLLQFQQDHHVSIESSHGNANSNNSRLSNSQPNVTVIHVKPSNEAIK